MEVVGSETPTTPRKHFRIDNLGGKYAPRTWLDSDCFLDRGDDYETVMKGQRKLKTNKKRFTQCRPIDI